MEDLLALQTSEASQWARQHVDACPACRAELEALYQRVARLKALPALRPARDRWPVVRHALGLARRRRQRRWGVWSVAAAATVAALVVFRPFATQPAAAAELARAQQQSAVLEATLDRYRPDGRVMTGRSAALCADLEDSIAAIDGELADAGRAARAAREAELVQLWRERVGLMEQLVSARVTRATYVGL